LAVSKPLQLPIDDRSAKVRVLGLLSAEDRRGVGSLLRFVELVELLLGPVEVLRGLLEVGGMHRFGERGHRRRKDFAVDLGEFGLATGNCDSVTMGASAL